MNNLLSVFIWRKAISTRWFSVSNFILVISFVFTGAIFPHATAVAQSAETTSSEHEVVDTVYPDWFKTSFMELEDDITEAQEAGKRLMLVFHQPGCPYCDALVERNLSQKDIEETVKNNFDVIEINMWGDLEVINVDGEEFTEKTFALYLEVQFTPTVLMYHPDGSIAMRMNGYFPPDKFRAALDYVINEDTDAQTFNEYLAAQPEQVDSTASKEPAMVDYLTADGFNTEEKLSLPGEQNKKPYVLLFEQQDCTNCVEFHNNVLALDETLSLLNQFNVYRINMWGRDLITTPDGAEISGRDFAKQLGINYAPTLVVNTADHSEVIRSESYVRKFHTQAILDYVLSNSWKEQPSFQRFLRERADDIRESGGTVSIME